MAVQYVLYEYYYSTAKDNWKKVPYTTVQYSGCTVKVEVHTATTSGPFRLRDSTM